MDVNAMARCYLVPQPCEKALKALRRALHEMELEVVGELEFPGCRILLVSCAILEFEALAFERSAAVFLPVHVALREAPGGTRISILNPTELFDGRFPVGSAGPIARLSGRVAIAVETLMAPAENASHT